MRVVRRLVTWMVMFVSFSAAAGPVMAGLDAASEAALAREVNQLLSGSNVTLRREIEKVYQLADHRLEQERTPEAIVLLRRALTVDARNLDAQMLLAELLQAQGEITEAQSIAGRVYAMAESPALLKRVESLNPAWKFDGGTNRFWNHLNLPTNGTRIVLIPIGESPTIAHRELCDELNRFLDLPVELKIIDFPLKNPERDVAAEWLSRIFLPKSRMWSPEQAALLGVDIDIFRDVAPSVGQQLAAMEAYYRLQAKDVETTVAAFYADWERHAQKSQYDADRLLKEFEKHYTAAPGELVLGVVAGDLFSGKANYIFSTFRSPYACMSFVRYVARFWQDAEYRPRARERMMKTAVWSTFGVAGQPACQSAYCMRTYVHSLQEEDELTNELCDTCRSQWHQYLLDKGVK